MTSHGGRRPGAGRKAGAVTSKTRELADRAAEGGILPVDYMLTVLRDPNETPDNRKWAAQQAAPYLHPKLAAVEHSGKDGGPIQVTIAGDDASLL
jgi:hypothetical protein